MVRVFLAGGEPLEHDASTCPVMNDPDAYGLHTPGDGCEDAWWTEDAFQLLHEQAGHETVYFTSCWEDPCTGFEAPV